MEESGKLRNAIERAAAGERVVIQGVHGEPLVALVSLEDLRELEAFEALEDAIDSEACAQYKADLAAGRADTVPFDEVLANLGLSRADLSD